MVIYRVCLCALFRFQLDWFGVSAEHRCPSWSFADLLSVLWELDIERVCAPQQFEERTVNSLRKPKRDASSVREAHFLRINGRTLCLFGVGISQPISGRARIPEIPPKEQALFLVVLQYREERCIRMSLR